MLQALTALAERALLSWEPQWSGFLDGFEQEQALASLAGLSDLQVTSWGGFEAAERRRLLLSRSDLGLNWDELRDQGLAGLELQGNFLFDPAEPIDFAQALLEAQVPHASLGDIWLRSDRGAQGVVVGASCTSLEGVELMVRSVPVRLQLRPLTSLQPPTPRKPRRLSTVEASLRLDAVGSAGFGVSRSRMAELIRSGAVRINWQAVTSPSKEVGSGDRVQLQGRGELVIETAELTKKDRWRIALLRR